MLKETKSIAGSHLASRESDTVQLIILGIYSAEVLAMCATKRGFQGSDVLKILRHLHTCNYFLASDGPKGDITILTGNGLPRGVRVAQQDDPRISSPARAKTWPRERCRYARTEIRKGFRRTGFRVVKRLLEQSSDRNVVVRSDYDQTYVL